MVLPFLLKVTDCVWQCSIALGQHVVYISPFLFNSIKTNFYSKSHSVKHEWPDKRYAGLSLLLFRKSKETPFQPSVENDLVKKNYWKIQHFLFARKENNSFNFGIEVRVSVGKVYASQSYCFVHKPQLSFHSNLLKVDLWITSWK